MIVPMTARGTRSARSCWSVDAAARRYGDVDLSVALDLARRAALAIDNARLYRAALAANDAKANFLATMSHELRTPLTAIIGYEELLAEGITGAGHRRRSGSSWIASGSAPCNCSSLIDEILLYTRVEAGREAVRIEPRRGEGRRRRRGGVRRADRRRARPHAASRAGRSRAHVRTDAASCGRCSSTCCRTR